MRAQEAIQFVGNDIDNTVNPFTLEGGIYVLAVAGTDIDVTLEIYLPDGATLAPVSANLTTAGISDPMYLPPGKYQLANSVSSDFAGVLARVPTE